MAELALNEAVELGYVLAARIAEENGIRALAIKGPVLDQQGLRAPHPSVDVDLWVDPARRADMDAALRALGWFVRVPSTSAQIMPLHSITYSHASWPCELDIHDYFPGFLASKDAVFERMWARCSRASIAGVDVPCSDVVASAAIAGLHALRDPRSRMWEVGELATRLLLASDESTIEELAVLASQTGAARTLAPLAESLDRPFPSELEHPDLAAWRVRAASTDLKSVSWLMELRRTPKAGWPRLLWRAVVLTEEEIREAQPDAAPGAWGLFRARVRRLWRGIQHLPKAVLAVSRGDD